MATKMRNDSDDSDDVGGDDGGQSSAIERFKARAAELDTDDADDDADDAPEPAAADVVENEDGDPVISTAPTRREKKRERLKLRDELAAERSRNTELGERLARLEGQQSVLVQQRNVVDRTAEVDPLDAEWDRLQDEHLAHWRAYQAKGATATPADKAEFDKKARMFERRKAELGAQVTIAKQGIARHDPQEAVTALLRADNPDVFGHANALAYANAEFMRLRAIGRPDNRATFNAAMNAARVQFKLRPATEAPSERQKAALSGAPRGRGAGGGGDAGGEIVMTPGFRAIARAKFPGLPEKEAYSKWAQTVGPKLLKRIAESK